MTIEEIFLHLRKVVRTNGKYVMRKLFDDYLTGLITKKIVHSCFLCGSEQNLTKEHVLPKWVFESNDKRFFTSEVNKLKQSYIRATLPACGTCNSVLLNGVERYIQKTLSQVDLKKRFYSPDEWENVIRWLEIIDFKFQVLDLMTKFRAHKTAGYVPALSDFSIAFMREMSVRAVTSKVRLSLKRIGQKKKHQRANSLLVGNTIQKSFHYFHTNGQFIHLEIPAYNKFFFCFYEKEHKSDKAAMKEAKKIINSVNKVNSFSKVRL